MSTALTSTFGFPPQAPGISGSPIPPLETGDRLTRAEFRRRFEAMPDVEHAELIEGIVFMGAAVRHVQHGRPHRLLIAWLDRYIDSVPGLDGGISSSIGLDNDNEPQPDGYLFLPPGMSKAVVTPEGYLEGPPELVIEISASTTSIDLNLKFQAYRRNGVREYLVWPVRDKQIDWFSLEDGQYVRLPANPEGIVRSQVFPGLWLDTSALIDLRRKRLYAVLREGQATPEFAAFAAEVAKHAPPGE
jgi:Uma2 family endonuclease